MEEGGKFYVPFTTMSAVNKMTETAITIGVKCGHGKGFSAGYLSSNGILQVLAVTRKLKDVSRFWISSKTSGVLNRARSQHLHPI
jgi:hypothetical protein